MSLRGAASPTKDNLPGRSLMRLIDCSWFIFIVASLPWRLISTASWPRPKRQIIYLRWRKIESNNRIVNLRLSAVAISQIEIIHLRVMQREIPFTVCLRIDNDFFHSLLSYSRRIATLRGRNDGGLKIISTKVAGFIYVSVEFTLQIVSRFMRLTRADVTCFLTQFTWEVYTCAYAHTVLFIYATSLSHPNISDFIDFIDFI